MLKREREKDGRLRGLGGRGGLEGEELAGVVFESWGKGWVDWKEAEIWDPVSGT